MPTIPGNQQGGPQYNPISPAPTPTPAPAPAPISSGAGFGGWSNTPYGAPSQSSLGQSPSPGYGLGQGDYTQGLGTTGYQSATNVLDIRNILQQALGGYQGQANQFSNTLNNGANAITGGQYNVNLGQNFAGPQQLQDALHGGLDYFGQSGMSQGLNNINLQNNSQNQQLASQLGQHAGNGSLLSVLQGQNNFQSKLAGIPLLGEAQQGTYGRATQGVDLQNQVQGLQNSTQQAQQGQNLQNTLAGYSLNQNALAPQQSLLDLLSNLQGQQRGVFTSESQLGSKNFK